MATITGVANLWSVPLGDGTHHNETGNKRIDGSLEVTDRAYIGCKVIQPYCNLNIVTADGTVTLSHWTVIQNTKAGATCALTSATGPIMAIDWRNQYKQLRTGDWMEVFINNTVAQAVTLAAASGVTIYGPGAATPVSIAASTGCTLIIKCTAAFPDVAIGSETFEIYGI